MKSRQAGRICFGCVTLRAGREQIKDLNHKFLHNLHTAATSNLYRLSIHVAKQRAHARQDSTRSFRRRPRSAQRDILVRSLRVTTLLLAALLLGNTQRHTLTVRRDDECALLLRSRQAGRDVAECERVCTNAELRTPFFRDGLGETGHAGFGETVVCLAGVAVGAGRGGDVDDAAWFAVFDAEVGRCLADEAEGRFAVDVEDCVPVHR